MDTRVREILVKALTKSAKTYDLAYHWEDRFHRTNSWWSNLYDRDTLAPSFEYVNSILALYTPAEILAILAVARFEGIWRPE